MDTLKRLRPCPFCGTSGETRISENPLDRMPNMSGKPSPIISVEITHWCKTAPGQPSRNTITRTGRDMESAIEAWNCRAESVIPNTLTREMVSAFLSEYDRAYRVGLPVYDEHDAVELGLIALFEEAEKERHR